MLGAMLLGLAALLGRVWPGHVESSIPIWFDLSWGLAFIVGSALCLFGTRSEGRINGVTMEQVGLAILAVACVMCGVAVGIIAHTSALTLVSLLLFLLGGACFVEWLRINSMIRSIYRKRKPVRG